MKFIWVAVVTAGAAWAGQQQVNPVVNVNSRYIVESIEVGGATEFHLSRGVQDQIQRLIGERFDEPALDDLGAQIKKELHAKAVSHRVARGQQPEHVRVRFEVERRSVDLEVSVPKFLYHSKEGWTGIVEGAVASGPNRVAVRVLSDADDLPERYAGLVARYDNQKVGTDRVHAGFQFESYHQQWKRAAFFAPDGAPLSNDIYRTRQNFEPTVTVVLAKPLTLTTGFSFERFQNQFPAATIESAHAVINTLRYHRVQEDSDTKQTLDAGYGLRAATKLLAGDSAYVRHHWNFGYMYTWGRQSVLVSFTAGLITGRAPLFERFVLGNSTTLRGWSKYEVAPRGGTRLAHNTLEYRYRWVQVFYDTGAVWSRGQDIVARNAVGTGFRKDGFSLAVAFPIKEGRVDPVFLAGMNF